MTRGDRERDTASRIHCKSPCRAPKRSSGGKPSSSGSGTVCRDRRGRSSPSSRATPAWARRRCSRPLWWRRRQPALACCGPGPPRPRRAARSPRSTICCVRPSEGCRGSRSRSGARWPPRCCSKRPGAGRPPPGRPRGALAAGGAARPRPARRRRLAVARRRQRDGALVRAAPPRARPGAKVIATVRTGAADEALAALLRALPADHAIELPVEPLDPAALARLIHARTGSWMPPPALARLHEACGGNPLLALEIVARAGCGDDDGHPAAARPPRRGALGGHARDAPVRRRAGGADARGARDGGLRAGARGGARRRRARARRPARPLQPPADRSGRAGAHAPGRVACGPRQARRC